VYVKDIVHGRDQTKSVAQMQLQYDFEKQELEAKAAQEKREIVQRNIRNTTIGGLITAIIVLIVVYRQRNQTRIEKKRSDNLLRNILPEEVAEELKLKGRAEARHFDEVTVMFTDFKNFTVLSKQMSATALFAEIDSCFKAFDEIVEKYGIEKIKTIGDSYMCAGGLPVVNQTHAQDVVNAALEIQTFISNRIAEKARSGQEAFQVRIGIHTGPVVAGIVGFKKFAYDIWGDTVNTASRVESGGEAGKVNISAPTYALIKEEFHCTYRGSIAIKKQRRTGHVFCGGQKGRVVRLNRT
jgi:class 3 adenylate cyclase